MKNVYPVYSAGIRTRDLQQLVSSDNHQTRVPKNYEEPVLIATERTLYLDKPTRMSSYPSIDLQLDILKVPLIATLRISRVELF